MQATILHHIEPHLVYKISIVERCSPQYCWSAEAVRMHFWKQYGVEFYEGALIGVCFPFFSRIFSPCVWFIKRHFWASSLAVFHWILWTSRTHSQERVPLKMERLICCVLLAFLLRSFSIPFAFPKRSLSVPFCVP